MPPQAATAPKALGQLANAPLALVLAQVAFSRYLTIKERVPALQDALRKEYPSYSEGQAQILEFTPSGIKTNSIERWQFADAKSHHGVVIQQTSLVYHATAYEDYARFALRLRAVLQAFQKVVPDVFVERLGLRYVDVIVPSASEEPDDFVVPGLRASELNELGPKDVESLHLASLSMAEGTLVFRYVRGVAAPFLPEDLQPLPLRPAAIAERAEKALHEGRKIGLLDFDRFITGLNVQFDAEAVEAKFKEMHEDHSRAFRCIRTQHAVDVWSKRPPK